MKRRKRVILKTISVFAGLTLLYQTFFPTIAMALTGGPSQPEMQAFEPIGTTNMVDLSTGSFTYNIPLMDVEGYPINLSYHSGITMDQEASWVGLGWNINPGEINRQMRGIPDDFKGDQVTTNFNMKDNITIGFNAGIGLKITGLPIPLSLNASLGIFNNNYKGPGITFGITPSISSSANNKGILTGSLGINFNSQSGVDITPSGGFSQEVNADVNNNTTTPGITVGCAYNSRTGLKGLTMSKDLNSHTLSSSSISFSAPTYVPTMTMPLINTSGTLSATVGLSIFGVHPNLSVTGYFNDQTLATHSLSLPSYGYMYADQALNNANAIHDFNREKDIPFKQHIANLPISNFTYDLYSVDGQGVSGQFRPFRGDVGVLYDHECSNQSNSFSLGLELGFLAVSHFGIDLNYTNSNTVTDQWLSDNDFASTVSFQSLQSGSLSYEPFYMKGIGERTVNDNTFYNSIQNTSPMYVHLDRFGSDVHARNIFTYNGNKTAVVNNNITRSQRDKRNQCTSILTAGEATNFALDKSIEIYPYNENVYDSTCAFGTRINYIPRTTWPVHHMSEITVTNPDGKRYVYGLPAYNVVHNEATFAVSSTINSYTNDSVNLVPYSGSDNSTSNTKGRDNYYNEQYLPPYAHSYLLTGVLSPDYVDLTGDGISDDDLGEAVKINYTQVYSPSYPYRWRVPYEKDTANYQVGLLTDNLDDKGNYLYGNKEVWYTHSIESKTMVAQFILQDRRDGLGVTDENGGRDTTQKLKCLKEIDLYSKADLIKNGSKAVPIKTVHFVYSYTLCPGTPNSIASGGSGKLTLTKVYFTYGNNTEGALNSYQFMYSGFNPGYNHNRYDKWGYFKYNTSGMPSNEDFPYTLQDSIRTNLFATAWNMTGISLPSGGQITINYESNDYAYVQNERAGQMFLIKGMSQDGTLAKMSPDQLYTKDNFGTATFNNYVIVGLPTHAYAKDKATFNNEYLANVNKLYFKFLVDVDGKGHYEYVPGYANIKDYSRINDSTWAIQMNTFSTNDLLVPFVNPVSNAAWQFVRLNLPQYAYPGSNPNGGVLGVIESLAGILYDVIDIFLGFDGRAAAQNFGRYYVVGHSWVRLSNPNFKKYGGGARVREIDISDNWAKMASGQKTFKYGQTFAYTTTSGNQTISSGVATYEPLIGGDENPLRQPLGYDDKYLLAPSNNMYTETPLGESLYPSPGVVYSKVTVTNLKYPGVERTATGSTVNEFYTTADFPTLNSWTDIDNVRIQPNVLTQIFGIGVQDLSNVSQGFVVECNDMAGKQKSQEVYDENGALISSVHNYYNVDNTNVPSHLNNSVQVINANGSISTATVGEDIDVWEDMREQDTENQGFGATANNDFFVFPFLVIPVDIPIIFPDYSSDHSRFRSAVTTKYIHRIGILDSVVKVQNGSTVTTKNLLWDGETGEVVLTQSNNEFDAPVYNFTYPAHWAYDGMGPEYQNIGFQVSGVTITNGAITSGLSGPSNYFTPGDEVEYYASNVLSSTKLWVTQPASTLIFMDVNGNPVSLTNVTLRIIRSGRRNMSGTPVCTLASLVSPISGSSISVTGSTKIVQASGSLYNNLWKIPATYVTAEVCNSLGKLPDTCLAKFIDSVVVNRKLFAKPKDSIKLGKYLNGTNCGSMSPLNTNSLFYSLIDEAGFAQMSGYEAQVGGCTMSFTSYGGPVYLDSITPYKYNPATGHYVIDDTTGGCMNMYITRPTGPPPLPPKSVVVGEFCMSCQNCHDTCKNITINGTFNPYAEGMLGNWRPERNYVYYDTLRAPLYTSAKSDIWKNGIFQRFTNLWVPPVTGNVWTLDTADKNWTWTSRITTYDPKGNEVEDVDALGRYSGALYGYLRSLPTAVSSNARYQEIAFDGFEDYGFVSNCNAICQPDHFSFRDQSPTLSTAYAHTGLYSMQLNAGTSITETRSINYFENKLDSVNAGGTQFYMLNGGGIPLFAPDSGNYLISAWVKENATCGVTGYSKDSIVVSYTGSSSKYIFHSKGPVIEGWQRFEGRFHVPKTATAISVKLVAGSNTAYYDDIRMEPFAAEMKTYVYDPFSLRLLATLDENNYATIYEYNDEGILMRVKKETERGIMTIKESRSSYPR